jgi:hypothetical protein
MKRRPSSRRLPTLELALAGVMLAIALVAGTLLRALRASRPAIVVAETIAVPSMVRARGDDVPASYTPLADDPFFPSRTPPATRYRLAEAMAHSVITATSNTQGPAVLGTVVSTHEASFAICALNGGPPQSIRVGESIGGYRAESIERERVVFLAPDGRRVAMSTDTPEPPKVPNGLFDPNNPNNPNVSFPSPELSGDDASVGDLIRGAPVVEATDPDHHQD